MCIAFIVALAALVGSSAQPQLPPAPTRAPAAQTAAQETAIRAAIALHDQGKYDEAIAGYQAVLAESPDNVTALFEMAFSQLAKNDYQQTLATARQGAEYRSELLPMFYDLIGSALDASGEPQQAIAAYRRGVELVPDAGLYFNMAVTYRESLKDVDQARQALKKSIALDPERPESDLLLGQILQSGGYRTQALLALSRFLILSPASSRSLQAYGLWRALLRGSADTALTGTMRTPDKPAGSDEGDFTRLDAFIDVTNKSATAELDKGTPDAMALVGQIDAVLGRLGVESSALRASFVGSRYVPYFIELKERGYVEPFVYWASQRAPLLGAREWVDANRVRVQEFLKWSESYRWPRD